MIISKDEKEVAETLYGLAGMFTDKKTCNEKETSKVDSILVVEDDFTKAESLKPVVSVLSSAKTKQIDTMPLEQSDKQFSTTGFAANFRFNFVFRNCRVYSDWWFLLSNLTVWLISLID